MANQLQATKPGPHKPLVLCCSPKLAPAWSTACPGLSHVRVRLRLATKLPAQLPLPRRYGPAGFRLQLL
jgi:hypothetical protein